MLPGVPEGRSSTHETLPFDLGMAVANHLLTRLAFLEPRTDHTARPFVIPEGDAWFHPVVAAVVDITKTAATTDVFKEHMFGLLAQTTQGAKELTEEGRSLDPNTDDNDSIKDDEDGSADDASGGASEGRPSDMELEDENEPTAQSDSIRDQDLRKEVSDEFLLTFK